MTRTRLLFLAVFLIILAIFGFIIYGNFSPNSASSKPVVIKVTKGESLSDVAQLLASKKVIGSSFLLRIIARYKRIGGDPLPGEYEFKENMSYFEVIEGLRKGPVRRVYTVTIPEGFTVKQIAERLDKRTGIDGKQFEVLVTTQGKSGTFNYDFLKSSPLPNLEGYLFPKTYEVDYRTNAEQFTNILLKQFNKEIATLDWTPMEKRGMNLHQIITIASLIEDEAKLPEERALVSAVIHNRLSKGMPLNICATIQYVLPQRKPKLTEEDLKISSPYNTYLNPGLPPGPICNPGAASIKAALNPASVPYLYYVLTDPETGKHTFTHDYQEFLRAKKDAKN